jgi:hypothetical protein
MWLLTILLQGEAQPTTLQYTALERAKGAQALANGQAQEIRPNQFSAPSRVTIGDDFGRSMTFTLPAHKVLFQELGRALEGDRAVNLIASRSNAKLNEEAMADPTIRAAQSRAQLAQQTGLAIPAALRQ